MGEGGQSLSGQQGGLGQTGVLGGQGRAIGPHHAGDGGAGDLPANLQLEGAQHRVVEKGAALDHNVLAQIIGAGGPNDLVDGVLYHGDGQPRGDVLHRGPVLLGLLDRGVHKDRAPGPQVHRMPGEQPHLGEVGNGVAQGLGEGFNERTTAGGAGLVEEDGVHRAVADLEAFHILAADVENTVDFRIEECGSVIMGNRLYLTLVQHQCSFDERLAVTGRTGPGDLCGIRQFGVDLLDRADRCAERISVVVAVEGIEKSTIFADESSFGRRGTGINTEIAVSFVGGKIGGHDVVDTLARQKFVILGLIFKQRLKTGNLKIDSNFLFEPFFQCEKGNFGFSVCIHRRTDGCKQVGVVRYDCMLVIQF